MASVLKNAPDPQAGECYSNDVIHVPDTTGSVARARRQPQAIRTIEELAVRAGLEQEPVVRKWQEVIRFAVSEQYLDNQQDRWDQRRSISVLTLMSMLFWGAILAAALGLL